MIPAGINPMDKVMVGNCAGWLLSFTNAEGEPLLEIGQDDYYAQISANLPDGLNGGEYEFVIDGFTDEHYATVAHTDSNPERAAYVDLYLFWLDTASSFVGYAKNLTSLTNVLSNFKSEGLQDFRVARLAIGSVTRGLANGRYHTKIKAQEKVFKLANSRLVCGELGTDTPLATAQRLAEAVSITVEPHELSASAGAEDDTALHCRPEQGRKTADAIAYLATLMERHTGQYGRHMLLIRDGVLHIGPRPIPESENIKPLIASGGLLQVQALAAVSTDPNWRPCEHGPEARAPSRKQFKLLLRGRPDLRPGDVVEFDPPKEDVSQSGGHWTGALGDVVAGMAAGDTLPSLGGETLGDDKVALYLHGVQHKLGKNTGFSTEVTGVVIEVPDNVWDTHSRPAGSEPPADEPEPCSPGARAARSVRSRISRALAERAQPEIAEVRAANVTGAEEPPAQTTTLWRGLTTPDGGVNQSRRLPIQRPSDSVADGAPYLTPFAWGHCGLVLPRYPGTRVMVNHRHDERGEPVDMGALWRTGDAPESEPGDWWLILPAAVPEANQARRQVEGEEPVDTYTGKVSHDLIDADGNRVLEVAGFTLRFGGDHLHDVGPRPALAEADSVTIEHGDNQCKLTLKADGSIEMTGTRITLDAGSGDIVLKGGAVKVE